ncbi:MAG TPA: STAS domain-containing protein [Sphingobium sp.]|uniref:STAS domain-containing protein n=1 Tax=Sphingobium sp. TaxID=1912891 RepID=UPI002ED38C83
MTILLDGSVTVRTIDALRLSILDAFEQNPVVELDASAVAEVDLSLVQLIEAARIHASQESKTLRLAAPANATLVALLRRTGSLSEPTAEDIDFWCHGELPQ